MPTAHQNLVSGAPSTLGFTWHHRSQRCLSCPASGEPTCLAELHLRKPEGCKVAVPSLQTPQAILLNVLSSLCFPNNLFCSFCFSDEG